MRSAKFVLFFAFLGALGGHVFAQDNTPVSAVKAFYAFHRTHHSELSRSSIEARKKWFSPTLYKLFQREIKRQNEFLRKHPDEKPYFGEGLPFQPWDETCSVGKTQLHKKLTVKPDAQDADVATVRLIFAFPPPCKTPDTTEYTMQMVRIGGVWVIDDLSYDDGSTLAKDLSRVDYQ